MWPEARPAISAPYFTGREVLTTNGHVLMVFPHTDKKAKPGFIHEPHRAIKKQPTKELSEFPVKACREFMTANRPFVVGMNIEYLRRIFESMGIDKETDACHVYFEFKPGQDKNGQNYSVKIRMKVGNDNPAYAILMPLSREEKTKKYKRA